MQVNRFVLLSSCMLLCNFGNITHIAAMYTPPPPYVNVEGRHMTPEAFIASMVRPMAATQPHRRPVSNYSQQGHVYQQEEQVNRRLERQKQEALSREIQEHAQMVAQNEKEQQRKLAYLIEVTAQAKQLLAQVQEHAAQLERVLAQTSNSALQIHPLPVEHASAHSLDDQKDSDQEGDDEWVLT